MGEFEKGTLPSSGANLSSVAGLELTAIALLYVYVNRVTLRKRV